MHARRGAPILLPSPPRGEGRKTAGASHRAGESGGRLSFGRIAGSGNAEAICLEAGRRAIGQTRGRSLVRRRVGVRPTPHDTVDAVGHRGPVLFVSRWPPSGPGPEGPVGPLAALEGVAQGVEQAEVVRLLLPDRPGPLVRVVDEPGVGRQQVVAVSIVPGTIRASPGGELP